jgi:drug/metabolite transporter superfamily protein YnfA
LRHVWQIMRAASRHSLRMGRLSFGLFSFLVANLGAFSVATQAYGDFFILLILSWTLAFLLAVPVLVEREVRARQLAVFEEPPSVFRPKSVVGTRI